MEYLYLFISSLLFHRTLQSIQSLPPRSETNPLIWIYCFVLHRRTLSSFHSHFHGVHPLRHVPLPQSTLSSHNPSRASERKHRIISILPKVSHVNPNLHSHHSFHPPPSSFQNPFQRPMKLQLSRYAISRRAKMNPVHDFCFLELHLVG